MDMQIKLQKNYAHPEKKTHKKLYSPDGENSKKTMHRRRKKTMPEHEIKLSKPVVNKTPKKLLRVFSALSIYVYTYIYIYIYICLLPTVYHDSTYI